MSRNCYKNATICKIEEKIKGSELNYDKNYRI